MKVTEYSWITFTGNLPASTAARMSSIAAGGRSAASSRSAHVDLRAAGPNQLTWATNQKVSSSIYSQVAGMATWKFPKSRVHDLRHSPAVKLYSQTHDVYALESVLLFRAQNRRHANVAVTEAYLRSLGLER